VARDKDIPAPEGAPFGTGAALERMSEVVPAQRQRARPQVQPFVTRGPGSPGAPLGEEEDVSGGYDEALFAPSHRPDEPLTQGAPFGPGADFTPYSYESDQEFMARVARELDTPDAPREVRDFVRRLRQGL
jgi:hypothetical protein